MANIAEYAAYRVKAPGNWEIDAIEVPRDLLPERRAYMRKALRHTSFENCTDEELDNMLIRQYEEYMEIRDSKERFWVWYNGVTSGTQNDRYTRSGIPKEYTANTMKDFNWQMYNTNTKELQTIIEKFIKGFLRFRSNGIGLYIWSECKGSGKTMLSCVILHEIASRYGVNIKFVSSSAVPDLIKRTYKGEYEPFEDLKRATLLVLDDIGVVNPTGKDWMESAFYELINHRYNEKLPTIYTSNIPSGKLKLDDRSIDRIEKSIAVPMPNISIRQLKNEYMGKSLLDSISLETEKTPEQLQLFKGASNSRSCTQKNQM